MTFLKVLMFLIISSVAFAKEGTPQSLFELALMADFQCLDLRFLGVCPKLNRNPPIGIKIKYWQPEVFMETVKNPGDFTILEYGQLLRSAGKKVAEMELELLSGIKPLTVTSGNSFDAFDGSNLNFNEVHLYDFPLSSFIDHALCSDPPSKTLGIRYLTEMDCVSWRKGDIENKLPQSLTAPLIGPRCHLLALGAEGQCMKNWGPLYPRQGFVIAPSESVGSIVDSLRAISIAASSMPLHVVESPLRFQINFPIDKVQMVYPIKTSCFPIGRDPREWELRSKDGHYVWIYWHQRECCV